ncbi:MAG: AAA family ATPase [Bacteroidota bacterium]
MKHIQTHISHVFIAPPYVFKFKKSVDFGFLDYSTLEKRRRLCHREVELNRRLSDDIYLGVSSVIETEEGVQFLEEESDAESVVEYGVKMKQLAQEYFLHTYLENDTLTKLHLDRVADKLADFYNNQQPDEQILEYGKIASIKINTDENFEQTQSFIGDTISQNAYDAIQYFTNQYFERHADLFERRIAEERIVDGHGDLHLEHIHITPEKVQIYDCIEFNERFRYGDLAVDLAFLAMDLDFNGRWSEERYFVDQMSKKLDDPGLSAIIDFYKCYRAYVKGKVKSLQSGEQEVPQSEREKAARTASQYFNLSLRYALLGSHPKVLVFMGGVGTGKSTLARHFEQTLGLSRFSSDHIRKELANLPLTERPSKKERDKLYSRRMSERTYATLMDKMEAALGDGESVVLDATFSSRQSRQRLVDRLQDLEAGCLFVEATAPDDVVRERLKNRDNEKVVSDARLEDFESLQKKYDLPTDIDASHLIKVDTAQPLSNTITELYEALAENNLRME